MLIRKAMIYFEDAEKEPEIPTIKKISWNEIKEFSVISLRFKFEREREM